MNGAIWAASIIGISYLVISSIQFAESYYDYERDETPVQGLPRLDSSIVEELETLRGTVKNALEYTKNGEGKGRAWRNLAALVDKFGARFTGTLALEHAIDYMQNLLSEEFSDPERYQIRKEEVEGLVTWTRDVETATLTSPSISLGATTVTRNIKVIGSGYGSSTTDSNGDRGVLSADVIVVDSFEELEEQAGAGNVSGKIVVYNQPWSDRYGDIVVYRKIGPSRASQLGAVAALTRSLTDQSLDTLHTGSTSFEDGVEVIPCGCITVEDATMLRRLQDSGERVAIDLNLQYTTTPGQSSYNLVVDVIGRELPDEVVIIGAHSDSWDIGVGAVDDGGGVMITWEVLSIMKALDYQPRRTLRMVFWTAAEMAGYIGAKQYYEAHHGEDDVVMVMESDKGTFKPLGLEYSGAGLGKAILEYMVGMLKPIGATQVVDGAYGPDIKRWMKSGVSGISLYNANERFYWYHHTAADRMDVQDPDLMDGCSITWLVGALTAAEYSDRGAWYEGDHPGYHPVDTRESSVMITGGSTIAITVLLLMFVNFMFR